LDNVDSDIAGETAPESVVSASWGVGNDGPRLQIDGLRCPLGAGVAFMAPDEVEELVPYGPPLHATPAPAVLRPSPCPPVLVMSC